MTARVLQFLGLSFLLHLAWELLQSPLYACFADLGTCVLLCLRAAATGDMLFMLTIYGALAAVHRRWLWIEDLDAYHHPATWVLPPLLGVLLAVSNELWAVFVAHRWSYTASMPLIPVLDIGLTPVLQMIIVPMAVLGMLHARVRLSGRA